jgi:hypothetical protein
MWKVEHFFVLLALVDDRQAFLVIHKIRMKKKWITLNLCMTRMTDV